MIFARQIPLKHIDICVPRECQHLFFVCVGEEEQLTSTLSIRSATVAGVLLRGGDQQPTLWQDGGQPHLRPHPLGQKHGGARQVGWSKDRFPLDWCHHDAAAAGGLDPSPSPAHCGLLPYQGWPLDQLGGGNEGEGATSVVCPSVLLWTGTVFWGVTNDLCGILLWHLIVLCSTRHMRHFLHFKVNSCVFYFLTLYLYSMF